MLEAELQEKAEELKKMQALIFEQESRIRKEQSTSKHAMHMLDKL